MWIYNSNFCGVIKRVVEVLALANGDSLIFDFNFNLLKIYLKFIIFFQVLELQNTLDDLTSRVDAVKEENLKLRSENSVLGQYIENLMQASTVFQPVSPKTGRKQQQRSTASSAGHLVNKTFLNILAIINSCICSLVQQANKWNATLKIHC